MPDGTLMQLPLQTRLAPVSSVDAGTRTAEVVWAQGAQVRRTDWSGQTYLEELDMSPGAVDLTRLNNGAPLLDSHRAHDLTAVIGVVERAWLKNGEGRAVVRFSDRAEVAPILQDVKAGIIRNVSVGYSVQRYERISNANSDYPILRAVEWTPLEISLVAVGADPGAGLRSENANKYPCIMSGDIPMEGTTQIQDTQTRANLNEADRVTRLTEAGLRMNVSASAIAGIVAEGLPFDRSMTRLIEERAAMDRASAGIPYMETSDNGLRSRALMAEALCHRFGGVKSSEAARPYLDLSVVDMARECLRAVGVHTSTLRPAQIVERALHVTGDFPELLTAAGNRSLRKAYDSVSRGVFEIARPSTAPDFRTKSRLAVGEMPTLAKVNEHGEFTYGTTSEMKSTYALETFGRIFGISRQALVNDDLGAFTELSAAFGRAAAEFVAQQMCDLLQSNPVMTTDNVTCFHASHGNLAASGAAISVDSIAAGVLALRLMKSISGKPINIVPRWLVVPAAQEKLANQYTSTDFVPALSSSINPWGGRLEVMVDPRLDAIDNKGWYLAADSAQVDTLEYSYLDGSEGPAIMTMTGWEVDGFEVKCRLDFGAGIIDWRGLYKNPGA